MCWVSVALLFHCTFQRRASFPLIKAKIEQKGKNMKKLYFMMMISSILFSGCSNTSPQMNKNNNLVEVDVSKIGVENIKGKKGIHMVYDANDEKEKLYNEVKRIEKDKKLYQENEFGNYMARYNKVSSSL